MPKKPKKDEKEVDFFMDRLIDVLMRQVEMEAINKPQGVSYLSHSHKPSPTETPKFQSRKMAR
jgi:hypothetical protein